MVPDITTETAPCPKPATTRSPSSFAPKAEIDAALDRIRAASEDHFFASPEDVHWGHVTALADHAALLKRIMDTIYTEGEHANVETHLRSIIPVMLKD